MLNRKMKAGAIASVFGTMFSAVTVASIINASPSRADLRGNLTIEINGLNNQDGSVCLSLFNGSRGFPSDGQRAIDAECVEISTLPVQVTFDDLTYGSYAIAAYHDKNQDAQLNQGLFGIPTEGFAFSNDAPAQTGPASFQDAVFFLSQQDTTIQIQMRYLSDR